MFAIRFRKWFFSIWQIRFNYWFWASLSSAKVDDHLNCCFRMADDMLLETVVCDSTDPCKIFFCDENKNMDEESLHGIGSRPSPYYIERIAELNNFEVIRYFSADLNYGDQFLYDWEHRNDDRLGDFKLRRFWRLKKKTLAGKKPWKLGYFVNCGMAR